MVEPKRPPGSTAGRLLEVCTTVTTPPVQYALAKISHPAEVATFAAPDCVAPTRALMVYVLPLTRVISCVGAPAATPNFKMTVSAATEPGVSPRRTSS